MADIITDLGSNVSITCDLDENEVYWILLKTADPPKVILRSFSTPKSPFYHNTIVRNKHSVKFKHHLVINKVTADELGVCYCMNTRTPPKLSNSTRIYFTGEFIGLNMCIFTMNISSYLFLSFSNSLLRFFEPHETFLHGVE